MTNPRHDDPGGTESQRPEPEEMHWGIYLREDIKDLRQDLRELRREVRQEIAELRGEFGQLRGEFGQLRGEFLQLRGEFGELRGEFGELRKTMDTRFYWTIGIMVTLFGTQTAVITALIKL